jgi:hypothetical protein
MAHSNRQKIKDSRGGLTKNQARKANKSSNGGNAAQSSRLASVSAWLEDRINGKSITTTQQVVKKKRYNKSKPAAARRAKVIPRLEAQLKSGVKPEKVAFLTFVTTGPNDVPLNENDIKRINKELSILKSRVTTNK